MDPLGRAAGAQRPHRYAVSTPLHPFQNNEKERREEKKKRKSKKRRKKKKKEKNKNETEKLKGKGPAINRDRVAPAFVLVSSHIPPNVGLPEAKGSGMQLKKIQIRNPQGK